jgi:hypothetical protein
VSGFILLRIAVINIIYLLKFINKKFLKKEGKSGLKKSVLMRMGLFYFGNELLFSIEVAMTVPILLKLKVAEE